MSRPLRIQYPGSLWHITSRGNEKRDTFYDDRDRLRFIEFLGEAVRRFQWTLTAYVLMSNHFHLLIQLAMDSLSYGMQWLNGEYSSRFNRKYGRVGHLVQGRPDIRLVEAESYFLEVHRYNVLNPVRAYMVERPEDHEWSSYRATVGLDDAPSWLAVDNLLTHFGPEKNFARESYRRFIAEGIGSTRCPWDDLVGGLYLGRKPWLERMREKVELKPRAVAHPLDQRQPIRPDMTSIVATVATVMRIPEERVYTKRVLLPRMIASWLCRYEGRLKNDAIAEALQMRSASGVTKLVRRCDDALEQSMVREFLDQCLSTLRREKT